MNREERRRAEKRKRRQDNPLTREQAKAVHRTIREQRLQAMHDAARAFEVSSKYVLHHVFGFGKKRMKRYHDAMKFQLECIAEGRVTLEDMDKVLTDEVFERGNEHDNAGK